jgi:hypothetical protein
MYVCRIIMKTTEIIEIPSRSEIAFKNQVINIYVMDGMMCCC